MSTLTRSRMLNVGGALAVSALIASPVQGGIVLYVDDDAPPGGDGLAWETSFRFLQDALTAACADVGSIIEVRVAQGTYRPDDSEVMPRGTGDRLATFQLLDDVEIRGGFAGIGATDPDQQNIVLHETILSGDLNEDDDIDFQSNEDNSFNILTGSGTQRAAVLEGFMIQGGNAGGPADEPLNLRRGAGIWIDAGSPTIRDCTFMLNYADGFGAGVYCFQTSAPCMTHCQFIDNVAATNGGAMFNHTDSAPEIVECVFAGNHARLGGAVGNTLSSATYDQCIFVENAATVDSEGGASMTFAGNPVFQDCIFQGNFSEDVGGAVRNRGSSTALYVNCDFSWNVAGYTGGAAHNFSAIPLFIACRFEENLAAAGGAVFDEGSIPSYGGCSFVRNTAFGPIMNDGGAMFHDGSIVSVNGSSFESNVASDFGGAIASVDTELTVLACTFTHNQALLGGGMYIDDDEQTLTDVTFMANEAGNGGALFILPNANTTMTNAFFCENVPNSITGEYADSGGIEFADACADRCAGDLDASGTVGFNDLLLLLDAWGRDSELADLNGDGVVAFTDLLLLLDAWGPCP